MRVEALRRITALFLAGAGSFNDAHVDVFDDVFGHLIAEIETKARAELSNRLAPVSNAPIKLLRTLAGDDDHGLLQHGFMVYDTLFGYLRFAAQERHNWPAKAA